MPRANTGPRLKPNAAGFYEIHWTEHGRSKRVSTGTKNAAEAADAFRVWRQGLEREQAAAESATVRGLLEAYWTEHVEPYCASTASAESQKAMLLAHFAEMHPAEITPADVRAFTKKRRSGEIGGRAKGGVERGAKGPTIRRDLTTLVAALNHAVEEGRMKRGDVPAIPLPPDSEPRVRWLDDAELARLFMAAAEISAERGRMCRIELWLFLAYYTARRKEAIQDLTWDRVDFELGRIDFDPPGRRRTKKRRGVAEMHPKLRTALERAYAQRKPGDTPGTFSPWVLDHDGCIRTAFDTLRRRAGFGGDVTIHTLKHTSITHMLRRGVSVHDVAGATETSAMTITRVYGKHARDSKRAALSMLR
jgi:integrase